MATSWFNARAFRARALCSTARPRKNASALNNKPAPQTILHLLFTTRLRHYLNQIFFLSRRNWQFVHRCNCLVSRFAQAPGEISEHLIAKSFIADSEAERNCWFGCLGPTLTTQVRDGGVPCIR